MCWIWIFIWQPQEPPPTHRQDGINIRLSAAKGGFSICKWARLHICLGVFVLFVVTKRCCCCWPGPFCWERASISNWFPALLLIHLMRLFEDRPLWLLFALHAFSPWHDSSSASLGDPNTLGSFEIGRSGSWVCLRDLIDSVSWKIAQSY